MAGGGKQAEIYTWDAPWATYGLSLGGSTPSQKRFRLAVGSFAESYSNQVGIVQLDSLSGKFMVRGTIEHPYPATKVVWAPPRADVSADVFATCGDYLRIWEAREQGEVRAKCKLNNSKNIEFCAPLTSMDWNESDPNLLGTSSIDTTCTIWDLRTQTARTQLIAHDKEVYDIAFAAGTDIFASVGADGSVRMFDLRSLEHSTIMYEYADKALIRLAWNKRDPNYLAALPMDGHDAIVLDIRVPSVPAAELGGHTEPINAIAWAPHSSCHICTGGDDSQVLIWDLSSLPRPVREPILAYKAPQAVSNLHWSVANPDWICIAYADKVQMLRV